MNNEITINIKEVLALPDNSITDSETIRQIGLVTTPNTFSIDLTREECSQLGRKIKHGFEYSALYPHIMHKFDILPDGVENSDEINKILENINKKRKINNDKKL